MSKLENAGLFRSDSMDMSNDPRFFQGSILNKRLAAFSGLGVVSGLMIGFTHGALTQQATMDITTTEGKLHALGFLISCVGLFANVIATYVSVAQVYHVYRLETAGPTGFEMATSYYLNPNIVAWQSLLYALVMHFYGENLALTGKSWGVTRKKNYFVAGL